MNLGLSPTGLTSFDCQEDNAWITPRRVLEMQWCSEQSGEMHEYIVLKVSDTMHQHDVWLRFKPYSGRRAGDVAHAQTLIVPPGSALRANLTFENGIEYQEIVSIRLKVFRQFQGSDIKIDRSLCAAAFIEMLSLRIGQGVGRCTPQDLCEIWASQPDSDRRLKAFYWYEQESSGAEYLVLNIVGSSDFTNDTENWWVRLERDGAIDQAWISKNRGLVLHAGSKQTRQMVFHDGIPFESVIEILRGTPIGPDLASQDCWYYASTVASKLSMEVSDDLCDCPTEDLCEIWSGERGAMLLVNRAQWFQEPGGQRLGYLIINVSATKDSKHGIWVRLEKKQALGGGNDQASITRNRRRLLRTQSAMVGDVTFDKLTFGHVVRTLKTIDREMSEMLSLDANQLSQSALVIEKITQLPDITCYWIFKAIETT